MGRDKKEEQITSRPYGKVQKVQSKRARFGRVRQERFLEHLAATCNVTRSAAAAGVTPQCVYKRRAADAALRAAWGTALEQGYARIEAMLLERAGQTRPIEVSGVVVDEEPADPELAKFLLREHKRGLAGATGQGAPRRAADWAEVEEHFIARLKALKVRIEEGEDGVSAKTPPPASLVPLPEKSRGGDS